MFKNKTVLTHALIIARILLLVGSLALSQLAFAENDPEKLWEQGEKAYNAGRYREAISYYENSLSRCSGNLECVASNFNGLGSAYEALNDDKKAMKYYEEALAAARKINHRDMIATNLFNVGAIHTQTLNQYETGLNLFDESLSIFRELDDKDSIATVLFNMGKASNSLGRYQNALAYFNESLKLNRERKSLPGIAGNLNLIGNVYSNLGQYDRPLSYYQEALKINRQLNTPSEIATTLRNIADLYSDLVEFDKALPYYKEALDIQKKHDLRKDMSISLTNIGAFYKSTNQYDKALSSFEESLKISRAINSPAGTAVNLNNIGNVYADLGNSEAAVSYYQQALSLEKQMNRPHRTAIALNNIGMEYFRLGRYEQALHSLSEALRIERGLNNPHDIAARLNNIGAVYLAQKRYRDAEDVFLERKEIGKTIAKTRLIHAGMVEVYLATKRYNEALALLKELPPSWRDSRNRRMEYYTQYGLALKGSGLLRESAQELFKAVSIVEDVRRAVGEKAGFFAGGGYISRLTPHRELVAVLSEMAVNGEKMDDVFRAYGKDAASVAYYFAEMTKARTLLEAMADAARKYDDPEIPSELKIKESHILSELASIEDSWENTFEKGESAFKKMLKKKEELDQELYSHIAFIRKEHPRYAAVNYPVPIPAEELPLMQDEVLIEFVIGDHATYVFEARNGGVNRIHRINIPAETLDEKIREVIGPLNTGKYSDFSLKAAKELYEILLSQTMQTIKDTEKLIIVPDGMLGLLPFEALVITADKDYKDVLFMGDRWILTYSQSATILALTRLLKPSQSHRQLFALGHPIYDKSDPRYLAYKHGGSQPITTQSLKQYAYRGVTVLPKGDQAWEEVVFTPLPETEEEIKEIAKLFGIQPLSPDILLNVSANETNFRSTKLQEYRYIHLATHADLPGKVRGLKEPFIILGQVENKGKDDGFLTLSEVLELKLDAEMVVLSACSTAKGKLMAGEGVANFARAFQHAGARSVVVSLWEVASAPAVEYIKIFYGHLKAGRTRAEALRLARNAMKAKYPNPFFWAVFILHGDGAGL